MTISDSQFMKDLFDSLKNPILFADTGHIVRYANRAAREFYTGVDDLIGKSLFECHNPQSQKKMQEVLTQLENGLDEELIVDNAKRRLYMRAVRDRQGQLLGYYERFEPPRGS